MSTEDFPTYWFPAAALLPALSPPEDLSRCLRSGHSCPRVSGGLYLLLEWGQTDPQGSGETPRWQPTDSCSIFRQLQILRDVPRYQQNLQRPVLKGAVVAPSCTIPKLISNLEPSETAGDRSLLPSTERPLKRPLAGRLSRSHALEWWSHWQKQREAFFVFKREFIGIQNSIS